jgi:hemolysin activation/secretion protein
VPAPATPDGSVTIRVIEGRYGAVTLDNRSRLHNVVAHGVLAGLDGGQSVQAAPLERRLLILSDVPGVEARASLSPGEAVGTSDLHVAITDRPLFSGDLQVDNDGNPYTRRWRGGGTLNINDPLGIGDQASVTLLTSGREMQYARGAYQAQVGDGVLGAAYQAFRYEIGDQFGASRLSGTEEIASLYASYPLVKTYADSVRLIADFDYRTLKNDQAPTYLAGYRRAEVGTIGVTGTHGDSFAGGGTDAFSLTASVGALDIQSASALAADMTSARSEGGYVVFRGSVDRLQTLWGPFQLYGWVRGQAASKNLDIDEKMELGGAYAVRAYPEGEAYGDEGYVGTVELRMWGPKFPAGIPGRLQLAVFEDAGFDRFAVTPFSVGINTATRAGGGAGLSWSAPNSFLVRLSYAHRTGTPAATSYPESVGEIRFEAAKFF